MIEEVVDHGREEGAAMSAAEEGVAGAFRVGHETEDIATGVDDAGDVAEGAIWVRLRAGVSRGIGVAEDDAVVAFQIGEGVRIGEVGTFAVGDGDIPNLAGAGLVGEGGGVVFNAEGDLFADEMEVAVADEGAGEEAGFAEDLESVADAEDQFARFGGGDDGWHDRGEAGDGAAAEVVPVGESAREDDGVEAVGAGFFVPEVFGGDSLEGAEGEQAVLVAVRAGKLKDGEAHDQEMERE